MKKLNKMFINLYIKVSCSWTNFKESERGDTNFISMLLIIGIVVVLAGLFLTMGKNVVSSIGDKVNTFIKDLK